MGQLFNRERLLFVLAALATVSILGAELGRRATPSGWHPRVGAGPRKSFFNTPAPPRPPAVEVPPFFRRWRARYLESNASPDQLGLVRGIFLGDDSCIPNEVRELFRNAGLAHLLAASGYNCWIVALMLELVIAAALYFCIPFFPGWLALRARKSAGPLSRLAGAWLFWLWTDQCPPITRSVLMISGKFLLELAGFAAPFSRLLLVQYLVSLTVMPTLWRNASFQLTFGCLFGIVLLPPLLRPFRPLRVPEFLWNYFWTGMGAVLGTIPTTWIVFGEINFTSLLTNWFAVPPVSFVIMPLGLAQMLLLVPGTEGLPPLGWLAGVLGTANAASAALLHKALVAWMSLVPSLRFH
jgi:predicted membrane metal-binding protein